MATITDKINSKISDYQIPKFETFKIFFQFGVKNQFNPDSITERFEYNGKFNKNAIKFIKENEKRMNEYILTYEISAIYINVYTSRYDIIDRSIKLN